MKLVIAEKPSVAQSIASVIGATKREDGYLEGNGYRGKSLKRFIKHGCKSIIELEKWLSSVCENGGDEQ